MFNPYDTRVEELQAAIRAKENYITAQEASRGSWQERANAFGPGTAQYEESMAFVRQRIAEITQATKELETLKGNLADAIKARDAINAAAADAVRNGLDPNQAMEKAAGQYQTKKSILDVLKVIGIIVLVCLVLYLLYRFAFKR